LAGADVLAGLEPGPHLVEVHVHRVQAVAVIDRDHAPGLAADLGPRADDLAVAGGVDHRAALPADVDAAVALAALPGARARAVRAEPRGVADRHDALAGERVHPAQLAGRDRADLVERSRRRGALLAQHDPRVRDRRARLVDDAAARDAGARETDGDLV